jgi:uncharacterized protein
MQFLIIAYDYKDGGLERRLAVREQHIKLGDELKAAGNFLYGVAMLNEKNEMMGSVLIMEYPTRNELDEYLKKEPYVMNNVWEKIEVTPCRVGPSFSEK